MAHHFSAIAVVAALRAAGLSAAILGSCLAGVASAQDLDRDGLDDGVEQQLLERFRPTFVLSAGECDGAPARFEPDTADPRVAARDGTIYGQARPRPAEAGLHEAGRVVELHYFHLWARDCGRFPHAFDVEHVSALVARPVEVVAIDQPPAGEWQAIYWYAAAHEGTMCEASSGARAAALRAESAGPYVYVSRGKHASYLDPGHCRWGCGGDACAFAGASPAADIVNLGERDAPLNGAMWITSRRWALASKLGSDFASSTRARLDDDGRVVVELSGHLQATQAPVLAADVAADALEAAAGATSQALGATGDALEAASVSVGSAVKKTAGGVARFLRLR